MKRRSTPIQYMGPARYSEWYAEAVREQRRERNMRYLTAIVILTLPSLVALVLLGYAWSWL